MEKKYQELPISNDHWGRKQLWEEHNSPRISRCSAITNACSMLELSGAKNYTPKEIFALAYKILGFIEHGEFQGNKLDAYVAEKMKESFPEEENKPVEKKETEVKKESKSSKNNYTPSPYQLAQHKSLKGR